MPTVRPTAAGRTCPCCCRPPTAFATLVRALLDRIDTALAGPVRRGRRRVGPDQRAAVLGRLLHDLCCPPPAGRRTVRTEDHLQSVAAAISANARRDPLDLDVFLALADDVWHILDQWLWDERWPIAIGSSSTLSRRLLDLGSDVRTWFALTYHCRSRKDILAVSRVAAHDPEAGRRVARRLGIDPAARWYLLHTGAQPVEPTPVDGGEYLTDGCWLTATEPRPRVAGTTLGSRPVALLGPLDITELAAGVGQVAQTARLAAAAGLTGTVTSRDVEVERRIVECPQALAELSAILGILVGSGPALTRTLRRLYANDLNKTRTAAELGIHRSSLDYRLGRVRELTGLDPVGTRGIRTLAAALDADRLRACLPQDAGADGAASGNGGVPATARRGRVRRRRAPGSPGDR